MNAWLLRLLQILRFVMAFPLVIVMLPIAFFGGLIVEGPEASIDYAASVLAWWLE